MSKDGEIAYRIRCSVLAAKPESMEEEWGFSWQDLEDFLARCEEEEKAIEEEYLWRQFGTIKGWL